MIKNVLQFINQVKQEFMKITWSEKRQALNLTGIVFIMVTITSLYFFLLDWILSTVVSFLLNLGG